MPFSLGQIVVGSVVGTLATRAVLGDGEGGGTGSVVESSQDGSDGLPKEDDMNEQSKIDRLIELREATQPGPEAIDAFVGRTDTVADGATLTVEVTPTTGNDLRVERVYFDRRTSHTYQHLVGGVEVATSHQAQLSKPRLVEQGGKVVSKATNNSGSSSTFDFELEGWAIPT